MPRTILTHELRPYIQFRKHLIVLHLLWSQPMVPKRVSLSEAPGDTSPHSVSLKSTQEHLKIQMSRIFPQTNDWDSPKASFWIPYFKKNSHKGLMWSKAWEPLLYNIIYIIIYNIFYVNYLSKSDRKTPKNVSSLYLLNKEVFTWIVRYIKVFTWSFNEYALNAEWKPWFTSIMKVITKLTNYSPE